MGRPIGVAWLAPIVPPVAIGSDIIGLVPSGSLQSGPAVLSRVPLSGSMKYPQLSVPSGMQ